MDRELKDFTPSKVEDERLDEDAFGIGDDFSDSSLDGSTNALAYEDNDSKPLVEHEEPTCPLPLSATVPLTVDHPAPPLHPEETPTTPVAPKVNVNDSSDNITSDNTTTPTPDTATTSPPSDTTKDISPSSPTPDLSKGSSSSSITRSHFDDDAAFKIPDIKQEDNVNTLLNTPNGTTKATHQDNTPKDTTKDNTHQDNQEKKDSASDEEKGDKEEKEEEEKEEEKEERDNAPPQQETPLLDPKDPNVTPLGLINDPSPFGTPTSSATPSPIPVPKATLQKTLSKDISKEAFLEDTPSLSTSPESDLDPLTILLSNANNNKSTVKEAPKPAEKITVSSSSFFSEPPKPAPPKPADPLPSTPASASPQTPPPQSSSPNPLGESSDSETKNSSLSHNERLKNYEDVLQSDILEMDILRNLAWQGIPEARGLRAKYWKILLHYLPANKANWESALAKSRKLYQEWLQELVVDPHQFEDPQKRIAPDHPLSQDRDSKWNLFFKDGEILAEIDKDVKRTFPHLHFFNVISPTGEEVASPHYHTLKRILFIYAKLNPGIRYVQGMNELLGPIYYTFATDADISFRDNAEADAFFCFTNLMSEVMDNFCKTLDKSEIGVVANMKRLNLMLQENDHELWSDLEDKKMNPQFYSFRWITLLLSQEFELPDVLRLWDSLFADPHRFQFFYCYCCAMLLCVREKLLDGTFAENLKLLQSYPPIDFQTIFSIAMQIYEHTWTAPPPRKKKPAEPSPHSHHSHHSHHHAHPPPSSSSSSKLSFTNMLTKISPSASPNTRPRSTNLSANAVNEGNKQGDPQKPITINLPWGGKFQL